MINTRSVPAEVEHTLIWTKVPIYHPELVDTKVKARIDQDGLCGFTGNASPPPSPSTTCPVGLCITTNAFLWRLALLPECECDCECDCD